MKEQLLKAISELAKIEGARFISLTYKAKGTGEVARHTLLIGVNLQRAYRADLAKLKRKVRSLDGVKKIACRELIASLTESLTVGIGNNSAYTQKDTYENVLPGIKLHLENNELHLNAFSRAKVVLQEGEHKEVKSSEKTIAKNALRQSGRLGKFRQFILKTDNLEKVALNGKTLEIK